MRGRVLRVFGQVLSMLLVGVTVGQGTFLLASENPRPSGAWTGHPQEQSKAAASGGGETAAAVNKAADPQIAAMQSDLRRMRVLLNQMQMNLGFVQNTTTPLNHQFELEIQMWQILINQMERRLESMGAKPAQ